MAWLGYCARGALLFVLLVCCDEYAEGSIIAELSDPSPFRNSGWSFGEVFNLGSNDIVIAAVGVFDASGDEFVTPAGNPTGILRETDDSLLAGEQYGVVAVNGNDLYNVGSNFSIDPAARFVGYGYANFTKLVSRNSYCWDAGEWMANVPLDVADENMNPEPVSFLIWSLLVCAGFNTCFPPRSRRS